MRTPEEHYYARMLVRKVKFKILSGTIRVEHSAQLKLCGKYTFITLSLKQIFRRVKRFGICLVFFENFDNL